MAANQKAVQKTKPSKSVRNVLAELKKVNWPNRKEITSYVLIVLVMCGLTTLVLGVCDALFKWGIGQMMTLSN